MTPATSSSSQEQQQREQQEQQYTELAQPCHHAHAHAHAHHHAHHPHRRHHSDKIPLYANYDELTTSERQRLIQDRRALVDFRSWRGGRRSGTIKEHTLLLMDTRPTIFDTSLDAVRAAAGAGVVVDGGSDGVVVDGLNDNQHPIQKVQDQEQEQQLFGQASFHYTVINIMKGCAGTGCVGLPYACLQGGLVFYVGGIVVVAVWNLICVDRLMRCLEYFPHQHHRRPSEEEGDDKNNDEEDRKFDSSCRNNNNNNQDYRIVETEEETKKDDNNKTVDANDNQIQQNTRCDYNTFDVGDEKVEDIDDDDDDGGASSTISTSTTTSIAAAAAIDYPPPGTTTLGQVAWYAFGPLGLRLMDAVMILFLAGVVVVYVSGATSFVSQTPFSLNKLWDTIVLAMIMGSLSIVPDLGHLAKASALGIFVLLASFLVIAGYGVVGWESTAKHSILRADDNEQDSYSYPPLPLSSYPLYGLTGISVCFGVVVFSYGVVPVAYNFRNSLAQPERATSAFAAALSGVSLFYIILGAGLLYLFPRLTGDVLQELPTTTSNTTTAWLPIATRLAMAWVNVTTGPIVIVICGELIEGKWHVPYHGRFIVRYGLCLIGVVLAIALPSFVQMLSLVGAVCIGTVGFILPPLFHLKLSWTEHNNAAKAKANAVPKTRRNNTNKQCHTTTTATPTTSAMITMDMLFDVLLLLLGIAATIISSGCMFREFIVKRNESASVGGDP